MNQPMKDAILYVGGLLIATAVFVTVLAVAHSGDRERQQAKCAALFATAQDVRDSLQVLRALPECAA